MHCLNWLFYCITSLQASFGTSQSSWSHSQGPFDHPHPYLLTIFIKLRLNIPMRGANSLLGCTLSPGNTVGNIASTLGTNKLGPCTRLLVLTTLWSRARMQTISWTQPMVLILLLLTLTREDATPWLWGESVTFKFELTQLTVNV